MFHKCFCLFMHMSYKWRLHIIAVSCHHQIKKAEQAMGQRYNIMGCKKIIHCSLNITKGLKKRFGELV